MLEYPLSLIAPHRCCSCGEKGALFCENCKNDIISEPLELCIFCLRPTSTTLCAQCQRKTSYNGAWCLGERKGALKALGDQYKFDCKRSGASEYVDMLDALLPLLPPDMVVMGVPTTNASIRVRGFDHVGRVARAFSRRRGLAVVTPLVRATTKTLHFLSFEERTRLGEGLFSLSGQAVPKRILVMDDIVTTGTTLKAAARLLREAGAEELYAVVWARQPYDGKRS